MQLIPGSLQLLPTHHVESVKMLTLAFLSVVAISLRTPTIPRCQCLPLWSSPSSSCVFLKLSSSLDEHSLPHRFPDQLGNSLCSRGPLTLMPLQGPPECSGPGGGMPFSVGHPLGATMDNSPGVRVMLTKLAPVKSDAGTGVAAA